MIDREAHAGRIRKLAQQKERSTRAGRSDRSVFSSSACNELADEELVLQRDAVGRKQCASQMPTIALGTVIFSIFRLLPLSASRIPYTFEQFSNSRLALHACQTVTFPASRVLLKHHDLR